MELKLSEFSALFYFINNCFIEIFLMANLSNRIFFILLLKLLSPTSSK